MAAIVLCPPPLDFEIVARKVIAHALEGIIGRGHLWEDYPEIGEHDFDLVLRCAESIAQGDLYTPEQYEAAYDRLAKRAEGVE